MAGYTRQSIADIVNGLDITAPPLTAEFNQLDAAFHATTGHAHNGSLGNGPKINLSTSVQGYLPAASGGVGGLNKTDATVAPVTTNDNLQGYAPGSIWINVTNGRIYRCVGNATNAAVWREEVQVLSENQITPVVTNTVDLGTTTIKFKDGYFAGSVNALNLIGNISGGSINNTTIGGTTAVAGTFTVSTSATSRATATADITLAGSTHALQIGPSTAPNLAFDTADIQGRNNGAASLLSLNALGGNIALGSTTTTVSVPGTATLSSAGTAALPSLAFTGDTGTGIHSPAFTTMAFSTNGAERMRIGSQQISIGTTTNLNGLTSKLQIVSGASPGIVQSLNSNVRMQEYLVSGVTVGFISNNGTSTTYSTTSDYRLKENVQPMVGALSKIAQLNPVTYSWKSNGSAGQGFIAHELQAVVPDCVSGQKDAVDEEGAPLYQGVDTSFLVATLVKAIQELKAEVDDLRAQISA